MFEAREASVESDSRGERRAGPKRREGRIAVPGGEVWYRFTGTGARPPLIVLHGGPGASSAALEPLAALAADRRVLFYDQLGGGNSPCAGDASLWRLERFVDELGAVRRALALDDVHLLGHSWGGFLALEYVLSGAPGILSLTLCSTAAGVPEFEREINALVERLPAATLAALRRHERAGTTEDAEYAGAVVAFLQRHLCRLDPWPEVLLEHDPTETDAYRTMWGANEFTVTGNLKRWDRTARLGEIATPTLVTCGRHDEATPACAETLRRGIPGARLHVFEESAHMAFLEQPEEFLRVAGDFLRAHDP
jgi:proline-specific peptidase